MATLFWVPVKNNNIEQENKNINKTTNNYICSIPVARGCKVTSYYLNSPLPKKNKHKIKTTVINENVYSIQIATCAWQKTPSPQKTHKNTHKHTHTHTHTKQHDKTQQTTL